jgi:hypothetical protein
MARQEQQKVKFIQMILQEHNNYWENKTTEMKKYLDAYNTRFWDSEDYNAEMIRVETADAYAYIEGFIAIAYLTRHQQ